MNITHKHSLIFSPNDLFAREQADITKATIENAGITVEETETTRGIMLEWTELLQAWRWKSDFY